ncbi:hypothetical protein FA95DRAFT_1573097 [Auriscalpium vulgare]|uniref:Uncharacterized protein n=1 Tax=Auriscalpium vulgare TaxID=40419 RepID=A0ACB8RR24_9AGAM|nr:hypothetical protein FA95DRAFT_1573097 [Auriscalpium vulgare]
MSLSKCLILYPVPHELFEELQTWELLQRARKHQPSPANSPRQMPLCFQASTDLLLQFVALSIVGSDPGAELAIVLLKKPSPTFLLAMDQAPDADDTGRAIKFFDLLSTTETVEPLIQFAMKHSLRKINVRLGKLRAAAVDMLESYRFEQFFYRHALRPPKGYSDLRQRAEELLPSVRELIGVAPGAVVPYDAVLRCLCDRISSTGDTFPATPSSADVVRLLHICTLAEFLLNTRFVSRSARRPPSTLTLLERRMYKVAVYAMGATQLVSARGDLLQDLSAIRHQWAHTPGDEDYPETAELVPVHLPTLDLDLERFWSQSQLSRKRAWGAMRNVWKGEVNTVMHPEARLIYFCRTHHLFPWDGPSRREIFISCTKTSDYA